MAQRNGRSPMFATERQLSIGLQGLHEAIKQEVAELAQTWDEQIEQRDKIISSHAIDLRNLRRDLNQTQADLAALRPQSLSRRIKRLYSALVARSSNA